MPIKKHDFIEVEYTGQLADGTVFDTTDEKVAKENNIFNEKMSYGPIIICIGEGQILHGLDEFLEGKELNKEYTAELPVEKAFGKKNAQLIKLIPARAFKKTNIEPQPGLQITVDDEMGTIIRVSSGRILVDFNHPLAGKDVVYKIKANREITDPGQKVKSYLQLALNLKDIKVEVKENQATVSMPMELPAPLIEPIKKKLVELAKIKDLKFVKTQSQQKPAPKQKNSSQDQ